PAGRRVTASTEATSPPAASVSRTETTLGRTGATQARAATAPLAATRLADQANGRRAPPPGPRPPRATACSAASRRTGCTAYGPASPPGTVTSAYTVSPARQAQRSPWKAGP